MGRAIGAAGSQDADKEAAEKFLDKIAQLVDQLDTPTLEQFGIDRGKFMEVVDKMAHDAMESGSPQNTMRDITKEDIVQMYHNLWN